MCVEYVLFFRPVCEAAPPVNTHHPLSLKAFIVPCLPHTGDHVLKESARTGSRFECKAGTKKVYNLSNLIFSINITNAFP